MNEESKSDCYHVEEEHLKRERRRRRRGREQRPTCAVSPKSSNSRRLPDMRQNIPRGANHISASTHLKEEKGERRGRHIRSTS